MRKVIASSLVVVVVVVVVAACSQEPALKYNLIVPAEFGDKVVAVAPERDRYTWAYEAFWWNCVMVKANDLNARCPFICSGTSGAAAGCGAGGSNAEEQISNLLEKFPASQVQNHLRSLASTPEARTK